MHVRLRLGLAAVCGLTALASHAFAADARLHPGMVITSSVRIARGTYRLHAPESLDSAIVIIRGSDITVDFAGAGMEGTDAGSAPDLASGVAIRIDGGKNIRILH